MPAPKGNQFGRKAHPATSHIHLRVTPAEKAAVVKAAGGEKLSVFIRRKIGLKPPE